MEKIQDSFKPDPVITSLTRICKMKQIQDSLKSDPVIYFIGAGQTLWTTLQPTFYVKIKPIDILSL
jgi:hypothetical protein